MTPSEILDELSRYDAVEVREFREQLVKRLGIDIPGLDDADGSAGAPVPTNPKAPVLTGVTWEHKGKSGWN